MIPVAHTRKLRQLQQQFFLAVFRLAEFFPAAFRLMLKIFGLAAKFGGFRSIHAVTPAWISDIVVRTQDHCVISPEFF